MFGARKAAELRSALYSEHDSRGRLSPQVYLAVRLFGGPPCSSLGERLEAFVRLND